MRDWLGNIEMNDTEGREGMNNLMGITVRPELVYDEKGNEWRERSLIAELKVKELEAQVDALKEIAKQNLCSEMPLSELDVGDIEEGYDQCILTARTALQAEGDIETELKSGDQRVQIEIPDEINGEKE